MKNKDILLEHLKDMDEFAELKNIECPPIYFLGGSGCILGDYIDRATTDFDFVDIDYPASFGRLFKMLERFDMLDFYVTPLPTDYKERAVRLNDFKRLQIYILSREDIIVSKLSRFSEKDIDDIKTLFPVCNKDLILKLIESVKNREYFSEKVKSYFIKNSIKFKELFYV